MRKWIHLVESLHDSDKIEAPNQLLDLEIDDDIDYANHWEEILEWPDTDSSVSVEEQLEKALEASGAVKTKLPHIYVTDTKVIEFDGEYTSVKDKNEWVNEADVDTYFPDYEQKWNDDFWKHPYTLFHATTKDNVAEILEHGIEPQNKTCGINNRSVGSAVFTTSEYEETVQGSYGEHVFEINMAQMAKSPDRPYVSQEPPIVEAELRGALAHMIGGRDYESDSSSDMSPYTVIVYGTIPPDCLTLLD